MPSKKHWLLLLTLIIASASHLKGQNGSLGDPVLNETFGVGSTYKPIGDPLPSGITNLQFVKDKCPSGSGQYTIASSSGGCLGETWHVVSQDRTKPSQPAGYMMIINASDNPDVFYTQRIPGSLLCSGGKYQFAVDILNILRDMPETQGYDQPNVSFIVEDANGNALQPPQNTGTILATAGVNWVNYKVDFTAPISGDVVVKLKNNTFGSMGNDLVLDNITVRPYGPELAVGFTTPEDNSTRELCVDNATTHYSLVAQPVNSVTAIYQWQRNVDNKGWENIPGATSVSIGVNVPHTKGTYRYRLGVLTAPGVSLNCQTFSAPLTVNVNAVPKYDLPAVTNFCEGSTLEFFGNQGQSYDWTGPNGFHSTKQSPRIADNANQSMEGIYTLVITGDGGCPYITKTKAIWHPTLQPSVENDSLTICEGDVVQLRASGGTIYKWSPAAGLDHDDISNPMASPSVTTAYTVTIGNGGCEQPSTVRVTVLKRPVAKAGPDRGINEGEPVTLHATAIGTSYYWTPSLYMDDPSSLTPTVNPPDNQTYILHVQTPECGIVTDEVNIRVFKKLTIPSTFTPNGDGMNDTWHIDKLITYPESVLYVYTREGKEVFRTVGDAKQWNGIYQGKALPAGVYYYIIDLKNNLPKQGGWVMLLR
ncbi:gliding motility-associated C-terminal domain-containing protein [Mucilaginibacter sp. 14171R-50]|uniref:gliding motility-associated C-terminal domain-containing protein n=1 Tax=Mucilaginibacter sp. 14171R-50 TaxID=2703789 RepID=UPI00138D72EE|nr:gliding motility-associated C-terminal domain-containing protein [Mucilaginibacter sp. 14171R-50]QHS55514.1 gliding motility-associated C-terminal domain-containing protein [Mucilaginibacter sp. 14171R-50]